MIYQVLIQSIQIGASERDTDNCPNNDHELITRGRHSRKLNKGLRLARSRMHLRRRLHKDSSGSSAVEFALMLPLLIALIFGIIEFGLIIFTLNTAESAARDATRQLATNRITVSQAQSVVLQQLPRWVAAGTSVSVSQTAPSSPSTNLFTTDVSFAARSATPTNLLSWAYGSTILHAKVSMQQEPGA